MNDVATQQRFVQLRCEGWSFARIAEELNISKPTLIKWSRKLQYDSLWMNCCLRGAEQGRTMKTSV